MPKIETIILSGDLDTLQLVNPQTKIYSLRRGVKDVVLYDENFVKEKFQGLTPGQVLDFKALRGDPSDNIPGVTGVGEKTAISLLLKFKTLENIFKEIEEKSEKGKELSPKLRENLLRYKEQAFLSKDLARLVIDAPIDFNLEKCSFGEYNEKELTQLFENYDFYSLIKRFPEIKKEGKKEIGENLKLW